MSNHKKLAEALIAAFLLCATMAQNAHALATYGSGGGKVEIKKAVTDVNIRTKPGTDGDIITVLKKDDTIRSYCTVNGWDKCRNNDVTGYINNKYLINLDGAHSENAANSNDTAEYDNDDAFAAQDMPGNTAQDPEGIVLENGSEGTAEPLTPYDYIQEGQPFGDMGRFLVPRLGINVGLNWADLNDDTSRAQYVCDLEDSACCDWRHGTSCLIIADHKHQGFSALYDAQIGDIAYIARADGSYDMLQCVDIDHNGANNEVHILDSNGNMASHRGHDAFTYTCNPPGWWTVTIVWWDYV